MLSKIYLSFLFLIYLLSLIVYIGFGVSAKQTWILVHTLQKHNLWGRDGVKIVFSMAFCLKDKAMVMAPPVSSEVL